MPLAAGPAGARPPGAAAKLKTAPSHAAPPSKLPAKPVRTPSNDNAEGEHDDDETTTDDSSDEEAAFEMDGQELWTQTYCVTCDCLIEPGEGIAKAGSTTEPPASPATHTTFKSRSGTIKGRGVNPSEPAPPSSNDGKAAAGTNETSTALKRTHSAGRLHAKAGGGPLGPHKRTGSAGSRLHALSELRPTTKLHDDKGKGKASAREAPGAHARKSPATSRPGSAASNRSHSNSSGPSSFKSNEATADANAHASADAQARNRKRGFLGGLGLTPAALKQQEAELAAKRKAPTPLYCSERCRLIDERRSSGLGELAQYLSQPLLPPTSTAWAPATSQNWIRSTSVSSMPMSMMVANTPESECLCPECMDKYADGGSASAAGIPSGASDTATESSSGYAYGRGAAQKPRTASGRLITPLGLHAPGAGSESYFPQYTPNYIMTPGGHHSPRVRPADAVQFADGGRVTSVPPRSSSAASGSKASTAGTEGSVRSSESSSSLWEPRMKPRSDSGIRNGNGTRSGLRNGRPVETNGDGTASTLSTNMATPGITPRQSMIVSSPSASYTARNPHRLSVPGFAPTHEVDVESQQHATSTAATFLHRPGSSAKPSSLRATSPLKLLDKGSQHHAAPSVDLVSDHVGSPSTRGSLLSRSLASEHTLMGASSITLTNQPTVPVSSSMYERTHLDGVQSVRQGSQDSRDEVPARRQSALSQSFSDPSQFEQHSETPPSDDGLSMVVGSLKLAQSRASGPLATSTRRRTDVSETRPSDLRRLSLFGVAGVPTRRNSNAVSISSSASGSTTSGWLRSLSSAWLNWRSTASPAPMQGDSDAFQTTNESDEWPLRGSEQSARHESSASRTRSHHIVPYAQKRASSVRDLSMSGSVGQSSSLRPADMLRRQSEDRVTPTQSLVARPTIRRGHVPAYVREIGHGDIPGDSLPADAKSEDVAALDDPAKRLHRARVDSLSRVSDADVQRKVNKRRSRDISVLPPLLAPISRSGSSTNLYAQMPRSARGYSNGRAWTAANTQQMFVGSAGSSHQHMVPGPYGQPPSSPTLMRSPYNSSFALAQDAARAALSPSRPNSVAGYHSLSYTAGTSPRAKGLGWGALTSIASPPAPTTNSAFPHHGHHRQSISYGHAAAQAQRGPHHHAPQHHQHHQHQQHQHHGPCHHSHGDTSNSMAPGQHAANNKGAERALVGHVMNLGAPPNSMDAPVQGRHSTMPVLHRSPTPSVPEDGGEMSSQDLTSGDFVIRPNSAMAGQTGRRHHRTSLMPPPRSRSSLGMHSTHHRMHPLTSTEAAVASPAHTQAGLQEPQHQEEPPRTWSYDRLPGMKTYPILQLPDRETHDVYDTAWGLDAGGLSKHLGQGGDKVAAQTPRSSQEPGAAEKDAATEGDGAETSTVQKGFQPQPHRKKLFYFDA